MTTNLDMIAQAHQQFNAGDLTGCEKTLARIEKNFALEHDEYLFKIVSKIDQPHRETAEKLIEDGKDFLVGDVQYLADRTYLRQIRTRIDFRSVLPYFEDDDMSVRIYFNGHFRFDETGIHTVVANGGASTKRNRIELNKLIEKWLSSKFGAVEEWNDYE